MIRTRRNRAVALAGAPLLCAVAVGALTAHAAVPPEPVRYMSGDEVRAAFAVGKPLVETGTYKVHASRREMPGEAEVHEIDTDIIYVLEGSATLVTGGTVEAPRTVAPAEIRGARLVEGSSRRLAPGDFMVVPSGVPHWFERVDGPFLYYVVKVPDGRAVEGGDR